MGRSGPAIGKRKRRAAALCGALLLLLAASASGAEEPPARKLWIAGPYSFSDEAGGFRITGASGSGTAADPIVIRQELSSASPVTMVIRAVREVRPFGAAGLTANGFLHLRIGVRNASGLGWIEFGFELQEEPGRASDFGDGLSFDQRRASSETVSSDAFRSFRRDFEPYDRLLFREGNVDPGGNATFNLFITDFTPRQTFYLVEDPRIPSS